jgi:hypothetical protein
MDHSLLHPVVNVANDNSLVLFVAVVKADVVTMHNAIMGAIGAFFL